MLKWELKARCAHPKYLHPVLQPKVDAVIRDVQGHFDSAKVQIRLFETGRSLARQKMLVANGTSKTLHSQHLTGRAADIVPYVLKRGTWQPTWENIKGRDGRTVWQLIHASAKAHGLDVIEWDGPHVQLPDSVPDW